MIYKLDENGHPLELEYYDADKLFRKMVYTYEYDSQGNWIKQLITKWEYKSGAPESGPDVIYYRTVSYY
jgi:hypothetical protein